MPPNNPSSSYDFITSSPQPLPGGGFGTNKKQRIIVIVLGGLLVLILIIVVSSFLRNAGKAQNQKLIELGQTQTEIVRIASIGVTKATSLETKSLAINTQLSVESARQTTKSVLKSRKIKVKDKQLAAGKNTKNDALLQDAATNNRFDQTFTQLIQTKLTSYQKQAKAVSDTSTPKEQKTFSPYIAGATLLLPKAKTQE